MAWVSPGRTLKGFELHYRKTTMGQMEAGELRGLDTQS